MRLIASVVALGLLVAPLAWAHVDFAWATIENPGNAADVTGFGSVADVYRISKFEVTNLQYAEFLNAVATTDTHGLYHPLMSSTFFGGILRFGSPGSYIYLPVPGRSRLPANKVSFWNAVRFANWLHNGQPTGVQDATTTEDGAYTLTADGIANNTVTRNDGLATFFVPSEDEWYKAAYYDSASDTYFTYPTGSDTPPTCAVPGLTANAANCGSVQGDLTPVASYVASASPSGTFDQGGNLWEWNEAVFIVSNRGIRGGTFDGSAMVLGSAFPANTGPPGVSHNIGFRVASIAPAPAPTLPSSSPLAVVILAGLLAASGAAVGRAISRPAAGSLQRPVRSWKDEQAN